jgi:hypothetical protein
MCDLEYKIVVIRSSVLWPSIILVFFQKLILNMQFIFVLFISLVTPCLDEK